MPHVRQVGRNPVHRKRRCRTAAAGMCRVGRNRVRRMGRVGRHRVRRKRRCPTAAGMRRVGRNRGVVGCQGMRRPAVCAA